MAIQIGSRLQHAWNAFLGRDPTVSYANIGPGYGLPQNRTSPIFARTDSILTMIYNRIATDVASVNIRHVYLDDEKRYLKDATSTLNRCFSTTANVDQTGRALILDTVLSMFDEGVVAIVPTHTNVPPNPSGAFEVEELRVCKIMEWFPKHVRLRIYNESTGYFDDRIVLPKSEVAIVENPFYTVMNEPNSIAKRLARKLALLDQSDNRIGSNKFDMIIQLPFALRGDLRKKQAEERRQQLEAQLANSMLGIGYIDATEHVTQLNRPIDNTLFDQVKYYIEMLYNQLGLTPELMAGTADEATMLNYYTRTVDPILSAICEAMEWKFLTSTARSQGQAIRSYRDIFRLVPVSQMAEIGDKFVRNEILTKNEIRSIIGVKPSTDPRADKLQNPNLNPTEFQKDPNSGQNGSKETIQEGEDNGKQTKV